ncbi:MAG: S-layer homology domain-containing protein [Clostridia bacterium]|nr:S-layer homology domain-containing protein [Clostridia bacterium]
MKKTKALALILAMAMLAVCLSGCALMMASVQVKINDDCTGTVNVRAGYSEELLEYMFTPGDESETVTFEYNGKQYASLEEVKSALQSFVYEDETYYGEIVTSEFKNLDELNAQLVQVELDPSMTETQMPETERKTTFRKGENGVITMDFQMKVMPAETEEPAQEIPAEDKEAAEEMADALLDGYVLLWEIEFPAPVKQTKGEPVGVSIEGNKLTLDFMQLSAAAQGQEVVMAFATKDPNGSFTDVLPSKWYFTAIEAMADRGIVNGMGDGTFDPEGTITYAQFCNIAAKTKKLDNGTENGYWAYKAVKSCIDAGYIADRGVITPANYDAAMPREAAVAAMSRIFFAAMDGTRPDLTVTEQDIPDYNSISDSYKQDVLNAYKVGITQGVDSNRTFLPAKTLSRAEVCQLFYNVLTELDKAD